MSGVKGARRGVIAPIDWARCGTEANYRRHLRLGQTPCAPCREAAARAWVDRKAARDARA